MSGYYVRRYIESSQRLPAAPRLSARHLEAFDLLDELAEDPDLHLDMEFRPGDIQFLHNHTIFHDRTAFEDWPEPERKRHLLRLWLCPPNGQWHSFWHSRRRFFPRFHKPLIRHG
jgi:hypothetical protein